MPTTADFRSPSTSKDAPRVCIAFAASQAAKVLPNDCKLRRVKYLNNVIEQDHRFVKKRVRAHNASVSFTTAERALSGVEAANMMRKG